MFGLPDRGDVLIYPMNFVAKRWERQETEFFENPAQKSPPPFIRSPHGERRRRNHGGGSGVAPTEAVGSHTEER